nr:hypothetical protein [Bacteroidaceae bacterium]
DGQEILTKIISSGYAKIDNVTLIRKTESKIANGGKYYLYNVEAGAFLGKGNNYSTQASVDSEDIMWVVNKKDGLYSFGQSENENSTLYVSDVHGLYVDGSSHNTFKINEDATSPYYYISVNPDDEMFGTSNYGERYIGWSGETSMTAIYPLLKNNSTETPGLRWMLLTEQEYAKYHDILESARSSRMAAWPVWNSIARNNKQSYKYAEDFNDVYSNLSATNSDLTNAVNTARSYIEAADTLALTSSQHPVDLSYLIHDADAGSLKGWNNNSEFWTMKAIHANANVQLGPVFIEKYVHTNEKMPNVSLEQTLTNLPEGCYYLTVDINAELQGSAADVDGVKLFATADGYTKSTFCSTPNGNFVTCKTPVFCVGSDGTATIGIKLQDATANWVAVDNFHLYYVGPEARYFNFTEEGTLVFTGTWREVDIPEMNGIITDYSPSITVDLTSDDLTLSDATNLTVPEEVNKNVLVYANKASNVTLNGGKTNVVVKSVTGLNCDSLKLTDACDVNIVKEFLATVASYKRSLSSSVYGTLCLPFKFDAKDYKEQLEFYSLGDMNEDNTDIGLVSITNVFNVGDPCLFKRLNDESSFTITSKQVRVVSSAGTPESNDGSLQMVGTFAIDTIGDITASNATAASGCYYISKDKFRRGKSHFFVQAFRAYLIASSGEAAERISNFGFYIEDIDETTTIDELNGDEEEKEIVAYYSINGQKIDKPEKGVNIAKFSDGSTRKFYVR